MKAELIWEEIGKDQDGFPIEGKQRRICVYANEKSVARAEMYESMRAGISVKTVLEVRQEDWEKTRHLVDKKPEYATKVIYDGCEYDVVRTWKEGKAIVEIVCG